MLAVVPIGILVQLSQIHLKDLKFFEDLMTITLRYVTRTIR